MGALPEAAASRRVIAIRARTVLLGLCLPALAAAIAILTWVATVDPLVPGSSGFDVGAMNPGLRVKRVAVNAFGINGQEFRVDLRGRMSFLYEFSIRNDGRVPVHIRDVGFHDPEDESIVTRAVRVDMPSTYTGNDIVLGTQERSFAPFTLASHEEANITMRVDVSSERACLSGGSVSWYTEPVVYDIYGLRRTGELATNAQIMLSSSDPNSC